MSLIKLLFPARCIFCGRIIKGETSVLCPDCESEAPFVKTQRLKEGVLFLSGNTSVFYYEKGAKQAVRRLKYYHKPQYANGFAALLAKEIQKKNEEPFDIVTWVPAYGFKTLRRGYNQAELLARNVANLLSVPAERLLARARNTCPQSGLTPSQRRANVLGAFSCAKQGELYGKRVLLIDDILTTGATASECARVLLQEKCREVYLGTVAKTREK